MSMEFPCRKCRYFKTCGDYLREEPCNGFSLCTLNEWKERYKFHLELARAILDFTQGVLVIWGRDIKANNLISKSEFCEIFGFPSVEDDDFAEYWNLLITFAKELKIELHGGCICW